ncbi:MAG: HK97 family phage prohead protease [Caulobacteraceae bacterium]|nr:HK97 family phage prohead protease [Caulobacteraceae bacterium]
MTPERRAATLEVRAKGRRLEGYAALFGVRARIADQFDEEIRQGAFTGSLSAASDILALVDHDPSRLLARTRSRTLRLSQDSRGLAFDLDVPDTSEGRDVLALAERGDLGGMSFGFTLAPGGEVREGGLRILQAVKLHEISVVKAWPAYQGTEVAARSDQLASPARLVHLRRYLEAIA